MTTAMTKRIPVSEETWKRLGRMKEAGQTYDQLLNEMIRDHNRMMLERKMERVEGAPEGDLVDLDEL